MYKKKLGARAFTAVTVASLLASNVTPAMAAEDANAMAKAAEKAVATASDAEAAETEDEKVEAEVAEDALENDIATEEADEEVAAQTAEATVKKVTVSINVGGDGVVATSKMNESKDLEEDDNLTLPKVYVEEGYKFEGWKVSGEEDTTIDTDDEYELSYDEAYNLCFASKGSDTGYVTFTAIVEPVEEDRIVNVTISVDPEKGELIDEHGTSFVSTTYENIDESSDELIKLPKVVAKEGYKFVGWKGQGADEINWDADATEFGVSGLAYFAEGATVGYVSIEAVFEEEDAPVEENRTVEVTITVDPEKGEFKDYGTNPVTYKGIAEDSDQQFDLPEVVAKEGYKFVGWKGQGADEINWDADAKTFGVSGLAYFAEGATVGYISIEAVFEKEEAPV
ncbi:InlB B-repeat-containing protein, partial [Brotaphodocola sp.]|uniref:InlB B-repeat-containing protein n=1 Tax=Brotaphodocola sp. TaxID=3073577 RepID=UPI003D7C59F1